MPEKTPRNIISKLLQTDLVELRTVCPKKYRYFRGNIFGQFSSLFRELYFRGTVVEGISTAFKPSKQLASFSGLFTTRMVRRGCMTKVSIPRNQDSLRFPFFRPDSEKCSRNSISVMLGGNCQTLFLLSFYFANISKPRRS